MKHEIYQRIERLEDKVKELERKVKDLSHSPAKKGLENGKREELD